MTRVRVRRSPGLRPGSRSDTARHLSILDFEWARLLPLGSLDAFAACFVIWQYQIDVAHAQRARKFKEGHDCRIAPASLQVADILLGEAGHFGEFLLREALLLPQSCEIPADQPAHVHLRKLLLYIL